MKKTGLLLLLCLTVAANAQSSADVAAGPQTTPTAVSFPFERIQAPTSADLYRAGFISQQLQPNANYVAGGLQTLNTARFVNGDLIYLAGSGYQLDMEFTILREIVDPNRHEALPGKTRRSSQSDSRTPNWSGQNCRHSQQDGHCIDLNWAAIRLCLEMFCRAVRREADGVIPPSRSL